MTRIIESGVIWDDYELRIFGILLWTWKRKRLTTAELMRRAGIGLR